MKAFLKASAMFIAVSAATAAGFAAAQFVADIINPNGQV